MIHDHERKPMYQTCDRVRHLTTHDEGMIHVATYVEDRFGNDRLHNIRLDDWRYIFAYHHEVERLASFE